MLHDIYKIMGLPEEDWVELDKIYSEIVSKMVVNGLTVSLSETQIDELKQTLAGGSQKDLKSIAEAWLGKQGDEVKKNIGEALRNSFSQANDEFVDNLTLNANQEQLDLIAKLVEE